MLQTAGRRWVAVEEGAHAVAGLVQGHPLCADDSHASDRGGVTAKIQDNTLKLCDGRGQG